MAPVLSLQEIDEIRRLRKDGYSYYKIAKLRHHTFRTIKKYLAEDVHAPKIEKRVKPVRAIKETPVSPIRYVDHVPEETLIKADEAAVEVRGVPIGKKIQFTPKNLTIWEWFKTRYEGWEDSDFSDYVNQCIGYFFKVGLGATLKIEVVQEYRGRFCQVFG